MIVLENRHGTCTICPHCGSTLLIQRHDIRAVEDFHNPVIQATCGACEKTIYPEKDIPKSWVTGACIEAGID